MSPHTREKKTRSPLFEKIICFALICEMQANPLILSFSVINTRWGTWPNSVWGLPQEFRVTSPLILKFEQPKWMYWTMLGSNLRLCLYMGSWRASLVRSHLLMPQHYLCGTRGRCWRLLCQSLWARCLLHQDPTRWNNFVADDLFFCQYMWCICLKLFITIGKLAIVYYSWSIIQNQQNKVHI